MAHISLSHLNSILNDVEKCSMFASRLASTRVLSTRHRLI